MSSTTPQYDSSKAYKEWEQDGLYCNDGRELDLLDFIYSHPNLDSARGSPENVLALVDEFARTKTGLINVGEHKGTIVNNLVAEVRPKTMVELGGYIGYSALLFGNAVRKAGGQCYWSLEKSPLFAAVARSLVDLAGLAETVRIEVGSSGESLERLNRQGKLGKVEMMFLDHHKPSYTADLKLAEELGIVGQGTTLVADNIILPGNPPYLEYVKSTVDEKREKAGEVDAHIIGGRGNPDLRYESRMIKCFEPSGMEDAMEITKCIGVVD